MSEKTESGFTVSAKTVQALTMVVLVGVCAWVGDTLNRLQVTVATQTETISTMKDQIRQSEQNSYTRSDAEKDFRLRDEAMVNMGSRISRLESALSPTPRDFRR